MVFMDNETYDQVEIPMDRLKWERNFIVPNSNVNISSYEGEILGVILPDKATLKVVECEQSGKEIQQQVLVKMRYWKLD